ncbi:hypothetical protein B5X24_HaOG200948 [Helicoverpa armigera]|uniref:Gustatory receptor n=1 Tax=Helicoverpa armigera TaxID=29058 RepID=A0A2W1B9N9_HELAM|nr:hypothetical protein B5X24_HaOG200948 [Helicoverpa armigera]
MNPKLLFQFKSPTLCLIQIIALLRLLLGNYINLGHSKLTRFLTKLYCVCVCSSIVSMYILSLSERALFPVYSFIIIDYTCAVILSIIFGYDRYPAFLAANMTNDRIIGFKINLSLTNYAILSIYGSAFLRICLIIAHFLSHPSSILAFCSITCAIAATDVNYIAVIIIFTMLHRRMKNLRTFLETNSIPINITGQDEIAISITNVRKSLLYYNNLLDNFQSLDELLQYAVSKYTIWRMFQITINWITNFSRTCVVVYFFVQHIIAQLYPSLVLISSPAIIVETIMYEVDRIKETLTTQILRCSDECLRFELQTALQYVRLRPFRYTLCRAVPLDINLLFTTAALCITYVIVALQLTHFSAY